MLELLGSKEEQKMSTFTYAILNKDGICIDRILVDENFNPDDYKHPFLEDLGEFYSLVEETEGEELFLDVITAPHIIPVQGVDSNTDILSQLSDDQKRQLVALLTQQNTENPTT
jgi:hypothetical protein